MNEVKSMNCPSCGAPIIFRDDSEYAFCTHCGTQVFKEDNHFDRRMEHAETMHEIDTNADLNVMKHKLKESILLVVTIAILLIFLLVFELIIH